TSRPEALGDDLLAHFETRLVLQTLDDDQSIHMLGQPDAAELADGELLARIGGRAPTRAHGFRVSVGHLDELLRLMREAYGHRRWGASAGPSRDISSETEVHPRDMLGEDLLPTVEGHSPSASSSDPPDTLYKRQSSATAPSAADERPAPDAPRTA